MRAWFSEERMQQLGYFSHLIAREYRIKDVNVSQASKALRNCTMRILKQQHKPLVSAFTLCTLVTHLLVFFKNTEDSNEMAHNAAFLSISTLTIRLRGPNNLF